MMNQATEVRARLKNKTVVYLSMPEPDVTLIRAEGKHNLLEEVEQCSMLALTNQEFLKFLVLNRDITNGIINGYADIENAGFMYPDGSYLRFRAHAFGSCSRTLFFEVIVGQIDA